jgi:hypothetical protein
VPFGAGGTRENRCFATRVGFGMSKPDAKGDNLESILASIRKSLAEQSTDVLAEDAAAAPPPAPKPEEERKDAKPAPRREGLAQRLAEAAPAAPKGRADDLADLVEEPSGKPAPAATAAPAAGAAAPSPSATPAPATAEAPPSPAAAGPARSEGDPLWFLTPGPEEPAVSRPASPPPPPTSPPCAPRWCEPRCRPSSARAWRPRRWKP